MKNDREEKKRYLLRKLSFRPTVEELKNRKVSSTLISDTGSSLQWLESLKLLLNLIVSLFRLLSSMTTLKLPLPTSTTGEQTSPGPG